MNKNIENMMIQIESQLSQNQIGQLNILREIQGITNVESSKIIDDFVMQLVIDDKLK